MQGTQVTAFDAAAAAIVMIAGLAVALAALAHAPRDSRARVFFVLTAAGAVTYAFAILQRYAPGTALTGGAIAVTAASFCVSSVATFHFTQVFPWRRPWLRAHRPWLIAAYVLPPFPAIAVSWFVAQLVQQMAALEDAGAGGLGAVSAGVSEALLVLAVIPVFLAVGVVLPFAGLMSLAKSWREARQDGLETARVTTGWMLISQMAGGLLAILVLPLLALVGVRGAWLSAVSALLYASALLMPMAFAAAVWRYRLLDVNTSA